MKDWKPHRARIVFRGEYNPREYTNAAGICVSTAIHTMTGVVWGTTPEEIAAAIKDNYPEVYNWTVVGLDNQRLDYEMVYGMAPSDCKFADSYYACK